MQSTEKYMAEQARRALVQKLTWLVDHHYQEDAAALFTTDGAWLQGGKLYKGHDEILASFAGTEKLVIRHHVTTVTIEAQTDVSARGVSYYMLYKGEDGVDTSVLPMPMPMPPLFSMGEWHDEFRLQDGEWRISSREVKRFFQRS